jgi:hypothetical protein
MPLLVVLLAVGWSAFWFIATSQAERSVDEWRAREAAAGRVYDCARRSFGGFPFRFEVRCDNASITLRGQTAEQAAATGPVTAKLASILVVAQVWDPGRLIAEFSAPATLYDGSGRPLYVANWKTARASAAGLPEVPQRISLVFEEAALDRVESAMQVAVARGRHVELHARLAEGSTAQKPLIEAALQISGGSVQDVHPVLVSAFDADIRGRLTGLRDLKAKPWPDRLRELQAEGGKLEITRARVVQNEMLANSAGTLALSANGRLDGQLDLVAAGLETIVPVLGVDKLLETGVSQSALDKVAPGVSAQDVNSVIGTLDKMIPGLSKVMRQNAPATVAAGINSLGTETTLEGRKARAMPLRFADGAVFLGPLKVGQTPPLY